MKKLMALIVILVVGAVLFSGCSGGSSQPPTPPGATSTPSANSVTLSNFSFSPETITVKMGTSVTWTNNDSTTHTITSDTGAFDSGQLPLGATFSYTFASRGSFAYHCSIHTFMKGTVIVE